MRAASESARNGVGRASRLQSLLLVFSLGATGWMALHSFRQTERVDQIAEEARRKSRAPAIPSVVYQFNAPTTTAETAQAASGQAPSPGPAVVTEGARPGVSFGLSEEERLARRNARFEQISAAFAAQNAADYAASRARALTHAMQQKLERIELPKGARVGSMDCRGRMCAIDVGFESADQVQALNAAALSAAHESTSSGQAMPRVHLATRPAADGTGNQGRLFFEWLAEDDGKEL